MTKAKFFPSIFPLLMLIFLGLAASCKAQQGKYSTTDTKAVSLFDKGLEFYVKKDYVNAQKNLEKAIERDGNFREALMLLGDIYADTRQYENAISVYQRAYAANPERTRKALVYMAEAEKTIGKYKDAEKHYREYLSFLNEPQSIALTKLNIERCIVGDSLMQHPISFSPQNLGPEINTADQEYCPTIKADEQTLIITRRAMFPNPSCPTSNGETEDFFISVKKEGKWSTAMNMGQPLNTNCNEGAQSISADGQFMFFAAIGRTVNGRFYESSDIYWTRRKGNGWEPVKNIGAPINTGFWESQPCISSDGKTLYFVSNKPGGLGESDIYSSTLKSDNTWSTPVNMGPVINTPGREFSPFIHPDDQTLYFASDYLPGLGGFDIFYSRKNALGQFQKPINIGTPLNTLQDEYGLVVSASGKTGYYASNNLKGYGGYDLYSFEMPESARPITVTYMKGIISDADTKKLLEATFELIDLKTGKVVIKSNSDAMTGEFLVCIPADRDYALNVSKTGYIFHSENFSLQATQNREPITKNIELVAPKISDAPIVLRNIFFATGSAELKPESYVELNKLVDLLNANPTMKIQVMGHTDNVGSKESNLILSDNRAKSVSGYLISKGIQADRLTNKGYGDTKPIDTNNTEEGRANNRRTEFKVTGI